VRTICFLLAGGGCGPTVPHGQPAAEFPADLEHGPNAGRDGRSPSPRNRPTSSRSAEMGIATLLHQRPNSCEAANQRSGETVGASGMFKAAFAKRRCVVPADVFYEWKVSEGGKQPYAIARQDGQPMAFAGLWEGFRWPDGTVTRTFTIITTDANQMIAELHDRMPVILEPDDWPAWLGEAEGDPATLLRPAGDEVLKVWPVSRQVNSPRNNGAELLEAAG
jgi:putative SOS response-associated peptidase YedK